MAGSSWLPQLWGESREGVEPFQALRRQFEDFVDEMSHGFSAPQSSSAQYPLTPRIDMCETDNEILISVELPGVEQKDLSVSLSGRQLTIKGDKRTEVKESKDRVHHRTERCYGQFQRIVAMPFDADPSSVSAAFHEGVLNVTVPKPANMRAKTIKIAIKSQ